MTNITVYKSVDFFDKTPSGFWENGKKLWGLHFCRTL